MNAAFAELSQKASRTDLELRQALATYQEREAALNQIRDSENRLTDTLLAVVEHVYEGLDLLRQDIHNGVPELPELGELPPPPEGVPSPLDSLALPPRPTRSAAPSSLPDHSAPGTIEEQSVPLRDEDSYPNELPELPEHDGAITTSVDASVVSPASEADLPSDDAPSSSLDLPLRAPFEAPSMDFDDLSNLEALVQKAPPTPSQVPRSMWQERPF